LSVREQENVGPARDIRGTEEARRRARSLGRLLDLVPASILAQELGS